MKNEHFDAFDYIIDEIWNIAINPQRSCGFAPYIMYMIEVVAHEKFYKDVAHEPLHPTVPKASPHRHISPPPDVAPAHSGHRGGASSSSSNFRFLKLFRCIFAMCHRTDQRMDMMECHLDEPVYPPVLDPYASLTPNELAAFGIGPSHAPAGNDDDDDGDEEEANDDEETEDDEQLAQHLPFFESFPFLVS
jgi:hypothetical protein